MSLATANRLSHCLSPYLLQHADNPVFWQPWDDEALALAHKHNVPILLSIGYASCHWCHVMEHESFADAELAGLMNDHFVCIKVDREERPDLDKTYQAAHYLLSRKSGGWPLTVFLSPNLVPFFTGTYFPPQPRKGMLSFREVLARVSHAWTHKQAEIAEQNALVIKSLNNLDDFTASSEMPPAINIKTADTRLTAQFDPVHGGLGKAPKFPQVPALSYALVRCVSGIAELRPGLEKTLAAMACGGLHDHVGGGFFRYCVDPVWDIPHFEKMHYDNAQLLLLYAHASVQFDEPAFAQVARRTAAWLLTELRDKQGGFYAAWDADSEGEEGKYYTWRTEQLNDVLGSDHDHLAQRFNVAEPPNFEGACHVLLTERASYLPPTDVEAKLLEQLRVARSQRVPPFVDDKVLAGACGLVASSLAQAGLLLNEPSWLAAAADCIEFCDHNMFVDGELKIAWRKNQLAPTAAFLDDHAYLLQARINLLGVACTAEAVAQSVASADLLIKLFNDEAGGLLFTDKEATQVLRKIRSCDDGAVPAGNGVAALCLLRLGWLLGRTEYLEVAQQILCGFAQLLDAAPEHSLTLTQALAWWHDPPPQVVLTGDIDTMLVWRHKLVTTPGLDCFVVTVADPSGMPAALAKPAPSEQGAVNAYVCRGTTCSEPVSKLDDLLKSLRHAPQ